MRFRGEYNSDCSRVEPFYINQLRYCHQYFRDGNGQKELFDEIFSNRNEQLEYFDEIFQEWKPFNFDELFQK